MPEPMGDAIALKREEAFVEKKRLHIGMAGGIALEHGGKIGADGGANAGIGIDCFFENFAGEHGAHILPADLLGEVIGERAFQPVVLEDCAVNEAGHRRFTLGDLLGLLAECLPDRIAGGQLFVRDGHRRFL